MKRIVRIVISILVALLLLAVPLHADMGPKPSVTLHIKNAPNTPYYVTLLSEVDHYGPWHAVTQGEAVTIQDEKERQVYTALYNYQDPDGYYFLNQVEECSDDHQFHWGYYPPNPFKVAIYSPETDTLSVSEAITRTAFDGVYDVTYGTNPLQVHEQIQIEKELLSYGMRLVLTIIIEIVIGLVFGYRKKREVMTILVTNIITQVLLNIIMSMMSYTSGSLVWFFVLPVLEIIVFAIEAIIYVLAFKDHKKWKTILYALIANAVTFVLGLSIGVGMSL